MIKKWKDTFLTYSKMIDFKKRVEESKFIVKNVFNTYSTPYIAFSGGKDSTCMTHLVLQQNSNIMVLHWDYGGYYIPRKMENKILKNAKKLGVKNLRIETSSKYGILKRKAINVLGRDLIRGLLPQLFREGYDASFIGLRSEESPKRKRRIKADRSLSKIKEIFPIASWTWMDIWAYIIKYDLPYLSHYDLYGPVVGWDRVRLTTFFDSEFDKLGCSNVDGILMWKFKNKEFSMKK